MTSRRPDFFIVGAPKAGTTALFEQLGRHPDVFVPRFKEPMFFGADQEFMQYRPTLDEYFTLFADAGSAVRAGEASTNYLYSRTAPTEIRDFNPDARIIIMLRDPIAVMRAQHSAGVWSGVETIHDFSAALEAQDRRRAGGDMPDRRGIKGVYYREIVEFAEHVGRYFDTFGQERVHIILFDDWSADTARVYRQTLEFLELDASFVPDLRAANPNRRIRSHGLHELIIEPPLTLQRAGAVLPAALRRKIRRQLVMLNTRVAPREPINPAVLANLRSEFAPKIERLAELIGRDLSAWMPEAELVASES